MSQEQIRLPAGNEDSSTTQKKKTIPVLQVPSISKLLDKNKELLDKAKSAEQKEKREKDILQRLREGRCKC